MLRAPSGDPGLFRVEEEQKILGCQDWPSSSIDERLIREGQYTIEDKFIDQARVNQDHAGGCDELLSEGHRIAYRRQSEPAEQ